MNAYTKRTLPQLSKVLHLILFILVVIITAVIRPDNAFAISWPPSIADDNINPTLVNKANQYLLQSAKTVCYEKYPESKTDYSLSYSLAEPWKYFQNQNADTLTEQIYFKIDEDGTEEPCDFSAFVREYINLGGTGLSDNYVIDYIKRHPDEINNGNIEIIGLNPSDQNEHNLMVKLDNGEYNEIGVLGAYMRTIGRGAMVADSDVANGKLDDASWYLLFKNGLNQCGTVEINDLETESDYDWTEVKTVKGEGGKYVVSNGILKYNDGMNENSNVLLWPGETQTCGQITDSIDKNIDAYVDAMNEYATQTNKEIEDGDVVAPGDGGDDSSIEEEDPCQAGFLGFGWLFCPGANLIDSFLNGFLNWIDSQLNWTMLAENNTVIRERWQNFLNIANIAFAIAFLVMIYSMATSTGLSNYDIKKMLPRLIVVAIAVNLSFYICAAIVDIFNIIGNGIFGIINPDGDTWSVSVGVDGFVGFGATIVAIIGLVFIFGISAIIALAIIFICLCVREIALIALVVISPIAFVCYLLPNTQKWFQRWADYFIRLLAIYPMFMAVWGVAKWVASLKGSTPTSDDVMPGFVISLTCMIAPAIAIIPLFKMSGGIMGMAASRAAGSKLAARGQAAQGYMRNRGKQAYHNSMIGRGIDRHRERAKDLDKQVNEGSYAGYNPLRRARQAINRGVNKIPVIGGAKGVSSDKDLGNFLKNYTYVDGDGNVQHLTDDQMLDYVQGRAAKDADGHIVLAAQNLNAEQIGSGIKALSGDALEDVYGKTTTSGAPVAATDASKRYAHLQATSNMHEIYAKHGIDIGKDTDNAYRQMREIARSGEYTDKSGKIQTVSSEAQGDIAAMLSRFDANAGSADAEKIFNEEAETFRTKRQFSTIKTTVSGFTDAAAKRESDEISQALGSAMKAREFKKNAFKSGASTPPSS